VEKDKAEKRSLYRRPPTKESSDAKQTGWGDLIYNQYGKKKTKADYEVRPYDPSSRLKKS